MDCAERGREGSREEGVGRSRVKCEVRLRVLASLARIGRGGGAFGAFWGEGWGEEKFTVIVVAGRGAGWGR